MLPRSPTTISASRYSADLRNPVDGSRGSVLEGTGEMEKAGGAISAVMLREPSRATLGRI